MDHSDAREIIDKLEEIRLRRGLSGEAIEELKSISRSLAKIEQMLIPVSNRGSGEALLIVIAILIGVALWHFW